MKSSDLDGICTAEKQQHIHEFADYCCDKLGIDRPELTLKSTNDTNALGYTDMSDGSVTIVVADRHQMDIMRTLAHELVHCRQMTTHTPCGETGSKDENEANALAGVLMREWGQQNPDLFTEEVHMKEANANQQTALYNPDGKTYRQQPMPSLDDDDPNNMAQDIDSFDDNEFAYDPETDQSIDNDKRNKKMANILKGLNPQEREVMKMRFVDDMSLGKIGKVLNLSSGRIHQIEQKALRKLRHPSRSDQLVPHTDNAESFPVDEAKFKFKKPKPSAQDRFNARLKDKHGIDLDANLASYKEMMDRLSQIDSGAPKTKADETFGDPSADAKKRASAAQQKNIDDEYVDTVASNSSAGIYKNTSEGQVDEDLLNKFRKAWAQKKKDAEHDKKNTAYKKRSDARTNKSTDLELNVGHRVAKGDRTSLTNPSRKAHNKRAVDKSTSRYKDGYNLPRLPEEVEHVDESKTARMMALITALGATYGLEDEARAFADQIKQNIHNAQTAEPNPGRPDPVTPGNMKPGSDRVMRPQLSKEERLKEIKKRQMMIRQQIQEIAEAKKDACYHKVRSRYKVWPSAYASGALVQCRKKGAKNWGNKSN